MEEVQKRLPLEYAKLSVPKGLVAIPKPESSFNVTKAQIQSAINAQDATRLRTYSQYFYVASGEYRRLVEYYGKLYSQDMLAIPRAEVEDMSSDGFGKKIEKVKLYIQNASISETNMEIATIVVRDGAFFGYEREIDGVYIMQQLPTTFCRVRYKMRGVYLTEFDFKYFDQYRNAVELEEVLSSFPKEFAALYKAYKSDQTRRWAMLDPASSRAHVMWDGIPLLAPIFLDLIDLSEYKSIEKTKSTLDIYKLLVQKIPLNKEGEVTMLLPEIEDLHDNFRKMISNNHVDVITTPADVELVDLADKNQGLSDDITKAKDAIYTSAGTSSALFHSGSKTGSVGLEASTKTDESLMLPMLKQFEKWYEFKLSTLSKDPKWSVMFLPTTALNRKDMFTLYKDAAAMGYPTKMLACASLGIRQFDEDFLLNYENLFLKMPVRMIPTTSSYTGVSGENGAPLSDEPLSDEGTATRESNKNANRA